ncbi:MAG TPA: adenylate/guanylate cyclase domain-containing protein, partial [Longimicrobiales bacterium]|nr:adenylate/guanylate cyclase domain-containing protein [Longimicrobiales bacterium]
MPRRSDAPERLLTTVMFTDIVGSTELAATLGDGGWRHLLSRHHGYVRKVLKRYRGREVDTAGDGFFATFDQPGRAITCATELVGG